MVPSEFKQLKDLRLVDDQGLKPEMLMLLEADTESVSVLLSQLKSYILGDIENSLNPVGSPIPWPNDNIPTGYAKINDGLTFDIIKFPRTALAWPSGTIPPHKGLVIECTADGAVTGNAEVGEIKSHKHTAKTYSKNLGTAKTSSNGEHDHSTFAFDRTGAATGNLGGQGAKGQTSTPTGTSGVHDHDVDLGSHDHNTDVDNTGISRNTVDRINYNMIVRLA